MRAGLRRRGDRRGGDDEVMRAVAHNKVALAFGALLVAIVVLCLLAPVYAHEVAHTGPNDNHITDTVSVGGKRVDVVSPTGVPIGPTWKARFLLGADSNGRDVAVRLLYGGRNSLEIGAIATAITMLLAIVLGTLAGYMRGLTDGVLSRLFDLVWAYPAVLLGVALGVALAVGGIDLGLFTLHSGSLLLPAFVIGVVVFPYVAKPLRAQTLSLREREFVDAARIMGYPPPLGSARIMVSEILPNLASTIVVFAPLIVANAILLEAALSYLGAGVQAPSPSWGTMIADGTRLMPGAIHLVLVPGIMLVLCVLSVNVLADAVRDALDPKAWRCEGASDERAFRARAARWLRFCSPLARSSLFAITVLTFLIFQAIPNGDPALRMAGRLATPQQVQDVRAQWGFDEPIYVQYFEDDGKGARRERDLLQPADQRRAGNRQGPPAHHLARRSAPGSSGWWWGCCSGCSARCTPEALLDRVLSVLALTGISMPVFFLGAIMLYWLGYQWHVLPLEGYVPLSSDPWGWFTHMLMPWVALSVVSIGVYSRVLRSNVLDVMSEDYVRTARAKGLSERRVLIHHVLRNSLIPIVTLWGLDFAWVIGGGAILVESVFNLGGVGQYAAQSIGRLDIPPVMVITMLVACAVVVLSAIVDVVYAMLDPRIRLS